MTTLKDVGIITIGSVAGKLINYVTKTYVPAGQLIPGLENKALANIAVGAGLSVFAVWNETKRMVGSDVANGAAVAGLTLIVGEAAKLAGINPGSPQVYVNKAYTPIAAVARAAPELVRVD